MDDELLYDDDEDIDDVTNEDEDEDDDMHTGKLRFSPMFLNHDLKSSRVNFYARENGKINQDEPSTSTEDNYDKFLTWSGEEFSENNHDDEIEDDQDFNSYQVLSVEDLIEQMKETIDEVNSIANIQPTLARILLNRFNWDKERLLERIYSEDDGGGVKKSSSTEDYLLEMIHKEESSNECPTKKRRVIANSSQTCSICFSESSHPSLGSSCGHRFCSSCWTHYLTMKVMVEGDTAFITCPSFGCDSLVPDEIVTSLITGSSANQKYHLLLTNKFVECNPLIRWCPKPGCNRAVKVLYRESKPVKCTCGTIFCFFCGEAWHEPVECSFLTKWLLKCEDKDSTETFNYLSIYTKNCPKCNVTIEKNGGCNHMCCRNCGYEFCWTCLQPMSHTLLDMNSHHCNRYQDSTDEKNAEKKREQLNRFLFYCNRYLNHKQSLKFEHKLINNVKDKMITLQKHNMSWIETQFLKKGVDVLCKCRQTLMYTYVFAYYLCKSNQQEIFEENQRDLELAVESLSGCLEREMYERDIKSIKQKVMDKYKYCEKRRKVLVRHVKEGYDTECWEFT